MKSAAIAEIKIAHTITNAALFTKPKDGFTC